MGAEVAEGANMQADPPVVPHTETKNVGTASNRKQDGTQQDDPDPDWAQLLEAS